MRASEFITEKKSRKKTKVRKAAYGPGLYGGYGYFSTYGNSDSTGGDGGGDGGGESIHENITPNTIHKLADRKGVKWDNEPSFLRLTKRLTGKEHLDDLDQVGLQKVQRHLEKQGVAEGLTEYKNTPLQDYNGLQFMIDSNHPYLRVKAFAPGSGQQLAQVDFKIDDQDELHPEDLHVEERWRGQGIAQIMYDFVKSKGYTIHRSWSQTDAGSEFWNKHRGQKRVWEQGVAENFADGKNPGRKEIDPDVYEDLSNSIIARTARQIVPTIRAKSTPEGYVYLSTQDGLSLVIGCNIAGGSIDINIGSQPMETTSSGPHKGAVTKIISAVYQAAAKQYGAPIEQGTLSIDHDAGHGVWQHIAQKLGLQYDAHMVKENFADGKNPQDKGDSKRHGVPTKASVSTLRKVAKQGGRKGQLAHWMANMKAGRNK